MWTRLIPALLPLFVLNGSPAAADGSASDCGIVVAAEEVTAAGLAKWHAAGLAVALRLTGVDPERETAAARSIQESGLRLEYFIEIGHCPELADAHPEWMSSLQGHSGWRRLFPDFPQPGKNEVVKNYPWVPVCSREAFDAHRERVRRFLADKPVARRIWLNDIQGGPSACGCGHPLCRWTSDYGPVRTATAVGESAPAEFAAAVRGLALGSEVIPIWVTECEEEDRECQCAGVDCFEGICWKSFSRQLAFVDRESPLIGLAGYYRAFDRSLERYGQEAGWLATAVGSMAALPPQRGGRGVPADRLILALQGWDVDAGQIEAQIRMARELGVAGWLLVTTPIDQSWRPQMLAFDPAKIRQFSVEGTDAGGHSHAPGKTTGPESGKPGG